MQHAGIDGQNGLALRMQDPLHAIWKSWHSSNTPRRLSVHSICPNVKPAYTLRIVLLSPFTGCDSVP